LGKDTSDQYEKRTRISEHVFTYWHAPEKEPGFTWDGKIFYGEDISNNVLNGDVFKTFSSSGSHATILKDQTPIDIEIRGKPVLIITTASANPKREIMRRFTNIQLDESSGQTEKIKVYQTKCAQEGVVPEYDSKITEALKYLRRVKVKIPFADRLSTVLPNDHIIIRTVFSRFLDHIKASVSLYQYQREKDDEGFLLATGQDYDIARIALIKTMSNPQMIPLTKDQKRILDIFKNKLGEDIEEFSASGFHSVSEIEKYVSFMSERNLRRQLDNLVEFGFLKKNRGKREESKKPVIVYKYVEILNLKIPTFKEIINKTNDTNDTNDKDIKGQETAEKEDEGVNCGNVSSLSSVSNKSNVSNLSNDNKGGSLPSHVHQFLTSAKEVRDDNGEIDYNALLKKIGWSKGQYEEIVNALKRRGEIYEASLNKLKLVE